MTFGERLKQLRKAAGENQTDLAIMLGKPAAITVNVEISTLLDGNSVDLEYIRQAVKEKMERDARWKDNGPLYLCDKRKCEKACGECRHTADIAHAENFELVGGAYVEKKHEGVIARMIRKHRSAMQARKMCAWHE